jgi:hypothetical protein
LATGRFLFDRKLTSLKFGARADVRFGSKADMAA